MIRRKADDLSSQSLHRGACRCFPTEVDDRLAKAWRRASAKKRKDIGNKVNVSLAKELMSPPAGQTDKAVEEYLNFLNDLRDEMSAKGLTQEELDEILNDE